MRNKRPTIREKEQSYHLLFSSHLFFLAWRSDSKAFFIVVTKPLFQIFCQAGLPDVLGQHRLPDDRLNQSYLHPLQLDPTPLHQSHW